MKKINFNLVPEGKSPYRLLAFGAFNPLKESEKMLTVSSGQADLAVTVCSQLAEWGLDDYFLKGCGVGKQCPCWMVCIFFDQQDKLLQKMVAWFNRQGLVDGRDEYLSELENIKFS